MDTVPQSGVNRYPSEDLGCVEIKIYLIRRDSIPSVILPYTLEILK